MLHTKLRADIAHSKRAAFAVDASLQPDDAQRRHRRLPRNGARAYIDGSYWTLALEWKFYALIAILIAVRQLARVERYLWIWMTVSLAYQLHPTAWLELLFIAPWNAYFIAGAAFFRARTQGWTLSRSALVLLSLVFGVLQASGPKPIK